MDHPVRRRVRRHPLGNETKQMVAKRVRRVRVQEGLRGVLLFKERVREFAERIDLFPGGLELVIGPLQKQQTEDVVLVLRGVHRAPENVRGGEQVPLQLRERELGHVRLPRPEMTKEPYGRREAD